MKCKSLKKKDKTFSLILFFIIMICISFSCNKRKGIAIDKECVWHLKDSFALEVENKYFTNFSISSSGNKLFYSDKSGLYIQNRDSLLLISKIGNGPEKLQFGLFKAYFSPNENYVFVFDIFSGGSFYVFDLKGNIKNRTKYTHIFADEHSPFISSTMDFIDENKAVIGLESKDILRIDDKDYSVAIINIDSISGKVTLDKLICPKLDNDLIRNQVEEKNQISPFTAPMVQYDTDKSLIHLKYIFDNKIYSYSRDGNLKKVYDLKSYPEYYNYRKSLIKKQRHKNSNYRQNYSNYFVESFQLTNNCFLTTLPFPIPSDEAPEDVQEVRRTYVPRVVNVYSIDSESDWSCILPKYLVGSEMLIQDSLLYFKGSYNHYENNHIYFFNTNSLPFL